MVWLFFWFLSFLAEALSGVHIQESPSVTCQSNNTECNPFNDNSIGNFGGIETLQVEKGTLIQQLSKLQYLAKTQLHIDRRHVSIVNYTWTPQPKKLH